VTLVRSNGRAAAPGLKPLCLPRAPDDDVSTISSKLVCDARGLGLLISVRWSVICCQELGCTQLLVGMLGDTGLVPFVDELGTVCWEVHLKYGFELLV